MGDGRKPPGVAERDSATLYVPPGERGLKPPDSEDRTLMRTDVPYTPNPAAAPQDEGTVMLGPRVQIPSPIAPIRPAAGMPLTSTLAMPPMQPSVAPAVPVPQNPYPMPSHAPMPNHGPMPSHNAWPTQGRSVGPQGPSLAPQGPSLAPQGPAPGSVPPPGMNLYPAPNLPVLSPPPLQLADRDPRLVLLADPDSARAASFRLLCDNLIAKRLPRVLAVTSALKKDGKTTCALNLALALAEGARVLLLEANLLEPALAGVFGIDESIPTMPNAQWLGHYKIGELSRSLHVAAPPLRGLAPTPRNEKQWFEQLVGSFRRFHYDFIIIDAAALSASPTVSQLVATADAVLLAVKSGVTTARALRRASEQIPEGKGIGIALIDAKPT